jgi:hypothetical protein
MVTSKISFVIQFFCAGKSYSISTGQYTLQPAFEQTINGDSLLLGCFVIIEEKF